MKLYHVINVYTKSGVFVINFTMIKVYFGKSFSFAKVYISFACFVLISVRSLNANQITKNTFLLYTLFQ